MGRYAPPSIVRIVRKSKTRKIPGFMIILERDKTAAEIRERLMELACNVGGIFCARAHHLKLDTILLRYAEVSVNAHRGKKRKTEDDPSRPPIIDDEVSFVPYKGLGGDDKKGF